MKILGISAYYHDSAITLIKDGEILYAAQEERFSRIKHDSRFPVNAIKDCLKFCNLNPDEIDHVIFYEKPFLKFERILETFVAFAPRGFNSFRKFIAEWVKNKIFQKKTMENELVKIGFSKKNTENFLFCDHHMSHAASAFYPSGFDEALVLVMDGVGEWNTTTVYHGKNNKLKVLKKINFPHSLGLLYSAFTYYCGFKVNSGEYKLMGLAPYGKPIYADLIKKELIDLKEDGSFRLNMKYFDYCVDERMTNTHFDKLFGNNYRKPEAELKQIHMDLAASIQSVLEEVIIKICKGLETYNIPNLCMAGGVALNCVANSKIRNLGIFKNIWVQPAAGDAGGSLGAALTCYYQKRSQTEGGRINPKLINMDTMKGAYLGPDYHQEEIKEALDGINAVFHIYEEANLINTVSDLLTKNMSIGWFQGRMEFGPRALGNRSIIANPADQNMQKNLNLKIKFRESFRPFAPAILAEDAAEWFKNGGASPYMLFIDDLKEEKKLTVENQELFGIDLLNCVRSVVPAITHVDYTARVQTVHLQTNPKFYQLISTFKEKTGIPMLVNTSFNIRGEPIVSSPLDAYRCFMGTNLDVLVIENFILYKDEQAKENLINYSEEVLKD